MAQNMLCDLGRYRRFVLDMQIPDWDEELLSQFNAETIADRLVDAHVNQAMLYAQNCVGVCFWPTDVGLRHRAMGDRDFFGELISAVRSRGIVTTAYYSAVFNNLIKHYPDWRIQDHPGHTLDTTFGGHRYGQCCPNHPDYYARAMAEIDELVGGYDFDIMFFDMSFWRPVCRCPHCDARYERETGETVPETVDWLGENWCRYQSARERWASEYSADLTARVKRTKPNLPTYHNFGGCLHDWTLATRTDNSAFSDLLGGDFYGDTTEQLVGAKMLDVLTSGPPIEFMCSLCTPSVKEHVQVKSLEVLKQRASLAMFCGAAFGVIDGIDPRGTLSQSQYHFLGEVFKTIEPYEAYLGGTSVADVAVYFSDDSKMRFEENGLSVAEAKNKGEYPHVRGVRGACRVLAESHIPFAVITRAEINNLSRYPVVVLSDILRITPEEAAAFREYVRGGGRLYASRWTSLTEANGVRHADFLLADVFGCHFASLGGGEVNYVKPLSPDLVESIRPQDYASHWNDSSAGTGMLGLSEQCDGEMLASLSLPYSSKWGSVMDEEWVSLHSSPPWRDTDEPAIVEHRFGEGRAIYSSADIETSDTQASRSLFAALMNRLREGRWSVEVDGPPYAWVDVRKQSEENRYLVSLYNAQPAESRGEVWVKKVSLRLPGCGRATRVTRISNGAPAAFRVGADGALEVEPAPFSSIDLYLVEYQAD